MAAGLTLGTRVWGHNNGARVVSVFTSGVRSWGAVEGMQGSTLGVSGGCALVDLSQVEVELPGPPGPSSADRDISFSFFGPPEGQGLSDGGGNLWRLALPLAPS